MVKLSIMKKREVEMHIVEVTGGNRTQRQVAENVVYYMIKKLMLVCVTSKSK